MDTVFQIHFQINFHKEIICNERWTNPFMLALFLQTTQREIRARKGETTLCPRVERQGNKDKRITGKVSLDVAAILGCIFGEK